MYGLTRYHADIVEVTDFYHSTTFCLFTQSSFSDMWVKTETEQQQEAEDEGLCLTTFLESDFGHFCENRFWIECISPWKHRFAECMGAMLTNSHHPYTQGGYCLFVIVGS